MNYEIIPQAPRYEMNNKGVIRNRETGRTVKWHLHPLYGSKYTSLRLDSKRRISVSLPDLLWQLHGIIRGKKRPVAVSIKKGTRDLRFDALTECATFLANSYGLSYWSIWYYLRERRTQIKDWQVSYFDPENTAWDRGSPKEKPPVGGERN